MMRISEYIVGGQLLSCFCPTLYVRRSDLISKLGRRSTVVTIMGCHLRYAIYYVDRAEATQTLTLNLNTV